MPGYNPLLPVTDQPIVRARVFGTILDQSTQNTFYWKTDSTPLVNPDMGLFSINLMTTWFDKYNSALGIGWKGVKLLVDRFDLPEVTPTETDLSAIAGDIVGDPAPSFVSMRLKKQTAIVGKRGRGVTRIPAVVESSTTGNKLSGIQLEALKDFALETMAARTLVNPDMGTWYACMATREAAPPSIIPTLFRAARLVKCTAEEDLGTTRSRMPRRTI